MIYYEKKQLISGYYEVKTVPEQFSDPASLIL